MNDRRSDMFNEVPEVDPDLMLFALICREATQLHGDDWRAVQQSIKDRVEALPAEQRQRIVVQMNRVLNYRAPDADVATH